MSIVLNFYGESKSINKVPSFNDFTTAVCIAYQIQPTDVKELMFTYFDDHQFRLPIQCDQDFLMAIMRQSPITIEIDISESSSLFKAMVNQKNESSLSSKQIIEEIEYKQALLKYFENGNYSESQLKGNSKKLLSLVSKHNQQVKQPKIQAKMSKALVKSQEFRRMVKQAKRNANKIFNEHDITADANRNKLIETMTDLFEKAKDKLISIIVKQVVADLTYSKHLKSVVDASKQNKIHFGVMCDSCKSGPISGIRYKCTMCRDFNLCESCEKTSNHAHSFIKVRDPHRL